MKTQLKIKNLIWLIITLVALVANRANAQNNIMVDIGLKGGTNFSKLSLSANGFGSNYSTGYHAGAFTRIAISKLYLQAELLYASKKTEIENASLSQKAKWNSIEVPVLLGYKILRSDWGNLRIFGGAVYSYVLNDKTAVLRQIKQSFKEFDKSNIGYQAGTGVDFGRLSLDLKYEGALTNLSKEFKSRPHSFQASIGLAIF